MQWLLAAIAVFAFGAGMAQAVPDQLSAEIVAKLEQLDSGLTAADPAAPVFPQDAITELGLADLMGPLTPSADVLDWAEAPTEPLAVERLNMRLMMIMLSQAYGSDGNGTVMSAQTEPGLDALVIRKGRVNLTDLRRILQENRLQRVAEAGPLVLKVPLVIWAGASLNLAPGDVLQLSRPDGAFVVNFGQLQIKGATIEMVGDANVGSPGFIPFVTTADSGTAQVQDARIIGLGFGKTMKFSGFAIMHNALQTADSASFITGTLFRDLVTVSISADWDVTLRGNHFRDSRGPSLIVNRTRGARIVSNLFSGKMPTNAIILEEGSGRGRIEGNIVLGGDYSGIVVRGGSSSATVAHNIVWDREGGGIALSKSECGVIHDNIVIDNGQKGIEVRFSPNAEVRGNTILSNHSAGIWVSDQPKGAQTFVRENVLVANGSGLAGAKGESILLDGNDFTKQFPQFLSGDLTPQSDTIARNLRGLTSFVLSAAGTSAPTPALSNCTD